MARKTEVTNPDTEEQVPEEALMTGGPGDLPEHGAVLTEESPATETESGEEDEETPPAAQTALFRGLSKTIEKPEELAAYALELERRAIESEAELRVFKGIKPQTDANPTTEIPAGDEDLTELLFSDPKAALAKHEQRIIQKIRSEDAKAADAEKFWNSFYGDFEDLRGLEDIVQLQLAKNKVKLDALPIEQARKILADDARTYVKKIQTITAPSETISSKRAIALSPSGNSPAKPKPKEKIPSLSEQLKNLRSRGNKTG